MNTIKRRYSMLMLKTIHAFIVQFADFHIQLSGSRSAFHQHVAGLTYDHNKTLGPNRRSELRWGLEPAVINGD